MSGNSTTPAILFMVEPAVATISICLPSIWSLAVYTFKSLPAASFRSAWSKRSVSLLNSVSKRDNDKTVTTENGPPISYPKPTFGSPESRSSTPREKRTLVDLEGRVSPLSEDSSNATLEAPDFWRWPITKSMELEERVRSFYKRTATDRGSRRESHQYWDSSGDLEMARSTLRKNPLPVPPKY